MYMEGVHSLRMVIAMVMHDFGDQDVIKRDWGTILLRGNDEY